MLGRAALISKIPPLIHRPAGVDEHSALSYAAQSGPSSGPHSFTVAQSDHFFLQEDLTWLHHIRPVLA